jgi:hypothetical protein
MGIYLNPGNDMFNQAVNSEIYVDKTGLIEYTNSVIATLQKYICVSRPRRFGKSIAANMLAAYYGRECDSEKLFEKLEIAKSDYFEKNLNKYDVIFLNMQEFMSRSRSIEDMIEQVKKAVLWDLLDKYKNFRYFDTENLGRTMQDIYQNTKCPFVFIIDEWDCVFREFKEEGGGQNKYLDFLRDILKDKAYIHLVYMTGILPIKKYGTHSALNMFTEFSMTNPGPLAKYVGFTEDEVKSLCEKYGRNLQEIKEWYDGYKFENAPSIYSPRSVISAVSFGVCDTYWNQTETFEALRKYIDMNFDGLRDDVVRLLAGEMVTINTGNFTNDMTTLCSKDDVLTLLIHLGYLGYIFTEKKVFIPNNEIRCEYANAVSVCKWGEVSKTLTDSADLLEAIWNKDAERVVAGIEQAHFETSHIQYNDENALSYTISLAMYAARNYYHAYRELPGGKGFADMVFVPRRRFPDKPAIVIELKWNKSAEGAISQIKKRMYCKSLEEYRGNILLVGITYDKKTKVHKCIIEENKS